MKPKPIESTDPEVAKFISDISQGKEHYSIKSIQISDTAIYTQTAPLHTQKVGRNNPCPCGSGKKYKKCCGKYGGNDESIR